MQAVLFQLSSLCGLLVFLNQAWSQAPLDRAIFQGLGTGFTIYLVAILGLTIIQRILAYTPPPEDQEQKEKVEIDAQEKTKDRGHTRRGQSEQQSLPQSRETAVAS